MRRRVVVFTLGLLLAGFASAQYPDELAGRQVDWAGRVEATVIQYYDMEPFSLPNLVGASTTAVSLFVDEGNALIKFWTHRNEHSLDWVPECGCYMERNMTSKGMDFVSLTVSPDSPRAMVVVGSLIPVSYEWEYDPDESRIAMELIPYEPSVRVYRGRR
jgi:hypothetical protein